MTQGISLLKKYLLSRASDPDPSQPLTQEQKNDRGPSVVDFAIRDGASKQTVSLRKQKPPLTICKSTYPPLRSLIRCFCRV
jgi:hypothetical protein